MDWHLASLILAQLNSCTVSTSSDWLGVLGPHIGGSTPRTYTLRSHRSTRLIECRKHLNKSFIATTKLYTPCATSLNTSRHLGCAFSFQLFRWELVRKCNYMCVTSVVGFSMADGSRFEQCFQIRHWRCCGEVQGVYSSSGLPFRCAVCTEVISPGERVAMGISIHPRR
ncbi:hypothetical protein BJY52DRAFT_159531 [Lactarius psammicola]|nr:hypothetical protein BJY52DRAFT_159531 [Lactarius psammicola]